MAAAVVALLRVDTLVLAARLLQRTVVDPWGEKRQIPRQALGCARAVRPAPRRIYSGNEVLRGTQGTPLCSPELV